MTITLLGVLCICLGLGLVLGRNAIARSGARWDNRIDGGSREAAEYTGIILAGGVVMIVGGVILITLSLV